MTFSVAVDHDHGGRWDSLRDPAGQEWCWSRPDPRRAGAAPGDRFVDVGGVEECFPTIAAEPDHGDLWTRPWTRQPDGAYAVLTPDAELHRRIEIGDAVVVSYRLTARPAFRFVWAFHLLVEPTADLDLGLVAGGPVRTWPDGYAAAYAESRWPEVAGVPGFTALAADDGTATFAVAVDQPAVTVGARGRTLRLELTAPGQPVAVGLWRNLGGFAGDGGEPYRSVGVEPMIGTHPCRALADPADLGRVGADGRAEWTLRVTQPDAAP